MRRSDSLDAMLAAPDHHEVLLESDHVRILDTGLEPGDRTPVHSHRWPSSLYILSWSDFIRRNEDGQVLVDSRIWETRPAPGQALWSAPLVPHWVENVGDSQLRIIAVKLKHS